MVTWSLEGRYGGGQPQCTRAIADVFGQRLWRSSLFGPASTRGAPPRTQAGIFGPAQPTFQPPSG